jgi:uncharacterized protein YerC
MVRLNKSNLTQTQLDKLFKQLSIFLSKRSPQLTHTYLKELLGPEERIMLAKRLACIILLHEECTPFHIAKTLKMSSSTVASIDERMKLGRYDAILIALKKSKLDYIKILKVIESIVSFGGLVPSKAGLDRYKYIHR